MKDCLWKADKRCRDATHGHLYYRNSTVVLTETSSAAAKKPRGISPKGGGLTALGRRRNFAKSRGLEHPAVAQPGFARQNGSLTLVRKLMSVVISTAQSPACRAPTVELLSFGTLMCKVFTYLAAAKTKKSNTYARLWHPKFRHNQFTGSFSSTSSASISSIISSASAMS